MRAASCRATPPCGAPRPRGLPRPRRSSSLRPTDVRAAVSVPPCALGKPATCPHPAVLVPVPGQACGSPHPAGMGAGPLEPSHVLTCPPRHRPHVRTSLSGLQTLPHTDPNPVAPPRPWGHPRLLEAGATAPTGGHSCKCFLAPSGLHQGPNRHRPKGPPNGAMAAEPVARARPPHSHFRHDSRRLSSPLALPSTKPSTGAALPGKHRTLGSFHTQGLRGGGRPVGTGAPVPRRPLTRLLEPEPRPQLRGSWASAASVQNHTGTSTLGCATQLSQRGTFSNVINHTCESPALSPPTHARSTSHHSYNCLLEEAGPPRGGASAFHPGRGLPPPREPAGAQAGAAARWEPSREEARGLCPHHKDRGNGVQC